MYKAALAFETPFVQSVYAERSRKQKQEDADDDGLEEEVDEALEADAAASWRLKEE